MLRIAARRQIAAQTHGDRAGGDFRKARREDDVRRRNRTRQTGGQRKRHGQPVRHADDNVTHRFAGCEMFFEMGCLWHNFYFLVRYGGPSSFTEK